MRIVYLGTGDIGLPTLRWLLNSPDHVVIGVVTQPDKPVGRSQILTPPPIKVEAATNGIPVFQPAKMRHPQAVAELAALNADLFVVMAYGQILPRAVLDLPKIACLNLHASILPRHRGAAPIQAAILSGDRTTGITTMFMDEGLDTGDILSIHEIPIRRRETGGSLHDRLAELGPDSIAEALRLLETGSPPRTPQGNSRATYAGKLEREHGEIRWNSGAAAVERLIRAMDPWPGAFTTLASGKKLKVFSGIRFLKTKGSPGEIVRCDARGILVGTGDGGVLITEVQQEGKRRMRAGEFIRGTPLQIGSKCLEIR